MDLETTRGYIRHRCSMPAVRARNSPTRHRPHSSGKSGGVPRLVNKLADFAMVYAVTSDKPVVDEVVDEVLADDIFLEMRDPTGGGR
jgi:general secretion pathway protein A